MKYEPKKITLDLQEWLDVQKELDSLKKPADGEELTEAEHQEATGTLLMRAMQNPDLFRAGLGEVNLGKYKASFIMTTSLNDNIMKVKFARS
jgi:hypothetical protein